MKTELKNEFDNDDSHKKLVNVRKDKETIENMLQLERHNVKDLENQIGGFREEWLKIKKEKHGLDAQLKVRTNQASELKEEYKLGLSSAKLRKSFAVQNYDQGCSSSA